jgi:hypothetical protein
MLRGLIPGKEAVVAGCVKNTWIYVFVYKFLRSCFRNLDTMSILDGNVVGELDNSTSMMVRADSAILFLSLVAKFNQPFLAGGLDVPRRGYHWKISCRELLWMVIASLAERMIM